MRGIRQREQVDLREPRPQVRPRALPWPEEGADLPRDSKKRRNAVPAIAVVPSGLAGQGQGSIYAGHQLLVRHGILTKLHALRDLPGPEEPQLI